MHCLNLLVDEFIYFTDQTKPDKISDFIYFFVGVNRYYYLCLDDLVALGGGGSSALRLDGDL